MTAFPPDARRITPAFVLALALLGGLAFGGMGGAGGVGWSNTNEGKVIAAAFLDAHNQLVVQARALQARELPPPVPTAGPDTARNPGG